VDRTALGQRIRQAREQRGLSQEELAALIGKDQRAVSEYERGKRRIAVNDLPAFAQVLGVPLAYFYEETLSPDDFDVALLREFHRLTTPQAKQAAIDIVRIFSDTLNLPPEC
jgi:transcriptional regulator with XRE-family HTH domain